MPLEGVEPPPPRPKRGTLSIELQGQNFSEYFYILRIKLKKSNFYDKIII